MQRTVIYGDKLVNDVDMNSLVSYVSGNILDYTPLNLTWSNDGVSNTTLNIYKGGILGDFRYAAGNQDLKVSQVASTSVVIYSGKALDSFGNLISIPNGVVVSAFGSSSISSWKSIEDGPYFVKLFYKENLTTLSYGVFGSSDYTRIESSYYVKVDNVFPALNEICLAGLTLLGGSINSFWDTRSYVVTIVPSWGVSLDPTLNTISGIDTAYDHVMARGTGIVTLKNPHGLAPEDIQALPSASLTKYGNVYDNPMLTNVVYKNGSDTIFFNANVGMNMGMGMTWLILPTAPLVPEADYSFSLFASSSGSTNSTGSLFGSVIELARCEARFIGPEHTTNTFYSGDSLQAFIPPNWYYQVTVSPYIYATPVGSVRYTTISD